MGIVEIFDAKEDLIAGKGVPAEKIAEAEKELKLSFDKEYREYLLTYGLIMCNGHELTGLGKSERTHVVFVTKQMKELKTGIPDDWYVLENENMDGAIIWQDAKGNVYFNTKKVCSSFSEFIKEF